MNQAEPGRNSRSGLGFFSFSLAFVTGLFFVTWFHADAKSALLRRFFMLTHKKASSARSLAPPFPQKGMLGSPARLQAPSQRLAVATTFFRVVDGAWAGWAKGLAFSLPFWRWFKP